MTCVTGVVDMEDSIQIKIDTEEGIATAETVLFFNDLFDSVNSSEVSDNILRSPVTEDSAHHTFWTNAKNVLRSMNYVQKVTHENVASGPTLRNWLFTIDGFEKLWKILHFKYDFTSLKTRYFNQDPIENFFGQIRSHAVRNNNPTPRQFQDSFITLLISNMKSVSIIGGNCETAEDPFMLFSLEEYLKEDLLNAEVCDIRNNDDNESHEMFSEIIVPEESSVAFLTENLNEIIVAVAKNYKYCEECDASLKNSKFPIVATLIVRRISKLLETRSYRNILKA